MRIGFNAQILLDPGFRGLTRYTRGLLSEFCRRPDFEVHLFSRGAVVESHIEGLRVKIHVTEGGRETSWLECQLPREMAAAGVDLFHAPADNGLPWVRPCPLVVTVHASYARRHWRRLLPRLKQQAAYWRDEWTNRFRAAAVLTPSDTTRAELIELGIAPAKRIHRIYLAAAEEFRPDPHPEDPLVLARHELEKPYILYVGGYDPWKNTAGLVGTFFEANVSGVSLVIVAEKLRGFTALVERFSQHSRFKSVRLIEASTREVPALYRNALFFANLSLWESFSFQVVEAMASGTPLLCSNRKALPEIAGDGAMYVDPEDPTAVAKAMRLLAEDSQLRDDLRGRGLERSRLFSWKRVGEETFSVYEEVLRRNN
jgi:glycosyltransferase involved in cell wall biosynthesis